VLNGFLYSWGGLLRAAAGFGLALLIYLPLYTLRGMGGGDVKFMAALGAIVGWRYWLAIFVLAGILGGLLAIALALARGLARKTFWNVGYILSELVHFRAPYLTRAELDVQSPKAVTLPYSAVIALGVAALLVLARLFPG
jgi:prepilin peptidase CpaA